jgi:recombination protein RecA
MATKKAKAKDPIPEPQEAADFSMSDFLDGDDEVKTFQEELSSDLVHMFPLNCPPIDIPFGGGLPGGKVVELFGKESSGKSTLAQEFTKAFANYWKARNDDRYAVLWIESESAIDKVRASYMGCPIDRFVFHETDTVEGGHTKIKEFLQRCIVKKNMKLLIVWDTIAAVTTEKTKEASFQTAKKKVKGSTDDEDDDSKEKAMNPGGMMEKPRKIREMFRDITTELGLTHSCFIVVNQVTTQVGTFSRHGPVLDSSGGYGIKHYASIRGMVSSAKTAKEVTYEDGSKKRFYECSIKMIKNKLTGMKDYDLVYFLNPEEGVDIWETQWAFLRKNAIFKPNGNFLTVSWPDSYAKEPVDEPKMLDLNIQTSRIYRKKCEELPIIKEWSDYKIYMHFAALSPLTKIKNIVKIWAYEMKFFGKQQTLLTEKEKEAAQILLDAAK